MSSNYIDMHCDTLTSVAGRGKGSLYENDLKIDLRRLGANGRSMEFFACFINGDQYDLKGDLGWAYACKILDFYDENIRQFEPYVQPIRTRSELEYWLGERKVGALLTIEEAGIINGRLQRVDELYARGVRLMTLTWNHENCLGFPNSKDARLMERGLKPLGFEAVERMEQLGMLVDVSHLSDGGFYDVASVIQGPFVASHSNARTLCPHPRNLTDDMLRILGAHGGVAGLNLYPVFLNTLSVQTEKGIKNIDDLTGLQNLYLKAMTDHLKHMINVGGEDVAAIGTDFDGFTPSQADWLPMKDVGAMSVLWDALEKAGLPESVIDKICWGNVMRVLRETL